VLRSTTANAELIFEMSGWAQDSRNRPDPVDAASCRVRKEGQNLIADAASRRVNVRSQQPRKGLVYPP